MFGEIWNAYLDGVRDSIPQLIAGAAVLVALLFAAQRWPSPRAMLALAGTAALVGSGFALARASVFDDAFISFRYVQNFLDGHGLVWNLDERVEGYTNFLWVMIVAGASVISRLPPAEAGLWASLLVFPLNLMAAYTLERRLALASDDSTGNAPSVFVPIATCLLAVQDSFLSAGSTGLETGFAALLVTLGVVCFVRARSPRDFALCGTLLILASLTRPDHGLYYAVAGACLVLEEALSLRRVGRGALMPALKPAVARMLAFAAPFALYAAHTAWRYGYYGELLPNTFYAKAATDSNVGQGLAYAATFYLGSHLVWLLPIFVAYLVWPSASLEERRFKRYAALAFVVFNAYVLQVGGDFMYGRFYVTLLPLVLVALARAVLLTLRASGAKPARAYALAALVGASAGGVTMIEPREIRWGICDERTMYPVARFHPLSIDHNNFRVAQVLRRWRRAGLHLRIATSGIGMIGYYSRMEVIDLVGLTDHHVARQELERRGRPGHEKEASPAYVEQRLPHLIRAQYHPDRHEKLVHLRFPKKLGHRKWYVYHYDPDVLEKITEVSRRARYTRFDKYLRRYIKREVKKRTDKELRGDDRFFKRFYFDHNDDPELHAKWKEALEKRGIAALR